MGGREREKSSPECEGAERTAFPSKYQIRLQGKSNQNPPLIE